MSSGHMEVYALEVHWIQARLFISACFVKLVIYIVLRQSERILGLK